MSDSQHPTEPPVPPQQPKQPEPADGAPSAPEAPAAPTAPSFGYGSPSQSTPPSQNQPPAQQPQAPSYGAPQQSSTPPQASPYGAPQQSQPTSPYGAPQQGQPAPSQPSSPYGSPQQGRPAQSQPTSPYGSPQQPGAGGYGAPGGPGSPVGPGGPGAPGYGTPAYGAGGYSPMPPKKNGLAIGSLIAGGAALLLSAIPFFNFFLILVALAGIAMGVIALVGKKASRGLAIAGTIVSVVALIATILSAVVWTGVFSAVNDTIDDFPSFTSEPLDPSADPSDTTTDPGTDSGDASDINAKLGETVVYDDGIEITVSAPEPYTPGQYAAGNDQAENVVFTVTVTNNTSANYDPFLYPTVSSAGTESSVIIDIDSDIEFAGPSTTVPPGQSVTFRTAYSVADSSQIVFEISPGFEYNSAVFTS